MVLKGTLSVGDAISGFITLIGFDEDSVFPESFSAFDSNTLNLTKTQHEASH